MSVPATSDQSSARAPFLSNKAYDSLNWVVRFGLPGLGALYFSLAQIWGLPAGEQVLGTITSLALFLGILLGISSRQYQASDERTDGSLIVDTSNPEKDVYRLDLTTQLDDLPGKNEIVLKVEGSR